MVLEAPRPFGQNDALSRVDVAATAPNALDLHADHRLVVPPPGRSNVTDGNGTVNFPPVYGHRPGDSVTPGQAAVPAQPESHDYVVKNGDSLWRIAKNSLTHGHRHQHVGGEQIWQRIREIVDANGGNHADLKSNPFFLKRGDHLIVPGAADAQVSGPAPYYSHGPSYGHHHGSSGRMPAPGERSLPGAAAPTGYDSPAASRPNATPIEDGGRLANALKGEALHQARHIGTVGDCARGPRQTFDQFGIKMRPMSAVAQGEVMERSGLFDRVSGNDVQPGDYGYRHWSTATIRRRGFGDLGDSFIVTDCNRKGWQAANDHMFTVPPSGGYYAPGITFLRPNAKFYAAVKHYQETGEKTRLS